MPSSTRREPIHGVSSAASLRPTVSDDINNPQSSTGVCRVLLRIVGDMDVAAEAYMDVLAAFRNNTRHIPEQS